MKIINKFCTILLVLFMTMHPLGALAASEGNAAISQEEAIAFAEAHIGTRATGPVTVSEIELERERNSLFYSIELKDEASVTYEVMVDANTGKILMPEDLNVAWKSNKADNEEDEDSNKKLKKMSFEDSSGAITGKYVTFTYTDDADISDFTLDGLPIFTSISIGDFEPSKMKIAGSEARFEMKLAGAETDDTEEDALEDASEDATEDATEDGTEDVTYNLKDSDEGTPDSTATPDGTEDDTPDATADATPDETEDRTPDAAEDATPDGTGDDTPDAEGTMVAAGISDDDDDAEKIKFELHDNPKGLIKIDIKGTRTVTFELAEGIEPEGDGTIVLTGEDFYGSIVQVGHEGGSVSFSIDDNTVTATVTDAKLMFRSSPASPIREEADHKVKVMQGIVDGDVAAEVTIEDAGSTNTVVYDSVTISIDDIKDDRVNINVNSEMTGGTTIAFSVSSEILKSIRNERVTILFDGTPIGLADNYDDIMNPDDDNGKAEFLAVVGAQGAEILVSIPHFSPHSITITTGEPAGQPGFGIGIAVMGLVLVVTLFRRRD